MPWYSGYTGTIDSDGERKDRYIVQGRYKVNENKDEVEVSELPVGTWTDDYKAHLEKVMEDESTGLLVKSYVDSSTDKTVNIKIKFAKNALEKLDHEKLVTLLKLRTMLSESNMHAFDERGRLQRFETPLDLWRDTFQLG